MKKILIAEDEPTLREAIAFAYRQRGWLVTEAPDGRRAIELLEREAFDVLVTDHRMPVRDGLRVLQRCRALHKGTAAVMLSGHGTVESAVEAIRAGAIDYVMKPFPIEELERKVDRALGQVREADLHRSREPQEGRPSVERGDMVGESPAMKEIFRTIRKVARSGSTVLILGETGTGKERVAEALHQSSERASHPLVKLNCAALPEGLLESELFGHERGAFTGADRRRIGRFELAHEGTLFLDEIGDMSAGTQAKVVRVLQEREFERLGGTQTLKVDVRLVAATHKDLVAAVERGEFRQDLYYRLNVLTISLPPLRERREDIAPLARHFAALHADSQGREITMDQAALDVLVRHDWPGNIRELENVIERAVLTADGPRLTARDLRFTPPASVHGGVDSLGLRLPPGGIRLLDLERLVLLEALRMHGWIQKEAARYLGISPRVMSYKVAKHRIACPREAGDRMAAAIRR